MSATGEVIQKLMDAKKEFKPLVKDKNNPFFKSKYADLPQVYGAVEGPLNKAGFLLLQGTGHWPDGIMYIKTQLLHVSGAEFSSTYDLPTGLDAQKMAAAVTYGKRVALCALLALASDDDDDGEVTAGRGSRHPEPAKRQSPQPPPKMELPPIQDPHSEKKANGYTPEKEPELTDPPTPEEAAEIERIEKEKDARRAQEEQRKLVSNPDIPQDAQVMMVEVMTFNATPRPVGTNGGLSYSIKVKLEDGEEKWTSTFHKEQWEYAKILKGQKAKLTCKYKGQYLNFFHIEEA